MHRLLALLVLIVVSPSRADERVELRFDPSAAEAVLDLLDPHAEGGFDDAWDRLVASEPYRRLKQREADMRRAFTDESFRAFVRTDELAARAGSLRQTLDAWRDRDLEASARRVLAYLPAEARLDAVVYPMIKPLTNSFVYDLEGDPAIFLYLDPDQSAAQFENTVAHELHHIGLASLGATVGEALDDLSPRAREAARWMGAFGEGLAMLAAVGGPDVHPHIASSPETRARWDRDVAAFDANLREVERFFLAVIDGELEGDSIRKQGISFFGVQGAWYTVGYQMAIVVERHFGRAQLIECMLDPRLLLARYNAAVSRDEPADPEPATWSPRLLAAVGIALPAR